MLHKHIKHHLLPHEHYEGEQHEAHALSLWSLFGYLQIFVFILASFAFIRVKAPDILGTASFGASEIIALTNAKRVENGLPALSSNGLLATAAGFKASDMLANNYWAHNSPSGKTPWSFISAAGYKYVYAGENLARDFTDPGSVVNAWMNSPSHRANLMDKNFKEIGVVVESGNLSGKEGILVVQMFGSSLSQVPKTPTLAQASPKVESKSEKELESESVKEQKVTKEQSSPSPSPEIASPTPSPEAIVVATVPDTSAVVLASRQFSVAKFASLGLIAFVFLLFAFEVVLVSRKDHLKMRPGVIAHLGLLGFVLFVIWYAVQGAIL